MRRSVDILIIGSGVAGLSAAIVAREAGLEVVVITKAAKLEETNTNYAQGGIIAGRDGDTAELLASDIYRAGCDYNSQAAVELLSREGPPLVHSFLVDKIGVEFSRNKAGDLDYTEEAAHSARRILHHDDHSGDAIESALIAYARKIGVEMHTRCTAIDLITNNHHSTDCQELYKEREVLGAYVLDDERPGVCTWLANAVVLACGGLGNIYQYTTNPAEATGDGISMAYRAGADVINAEFVQFHPTALYHKDIRRFLISESLRGEGAQLINQAGEPFMPRYSPLGDLAPRDVVARAIYNEMAREGSKYMRLDLASYYKGEKPLKQRFSRIYETCLAGGLDISHEPIPITPAAHYFIGGVKVDGDGRSSLQRLYAIGEVSCTGLHGANRLASTSLLEGLLWGIRAARHIIGGHQAVATGRFAAIPDWKLPLHPEVFEPMLVYQDWNNVKMTMWNHAGIIRTRKGLERASADLNYHAHRITKFYQEAVLNRDLIELRNGVVCAQIVLAAAIHNERSIGCHYRLD
ncbi:MAG: L-aspartate oxidase [Spirochaetes bacterium GWD1_61_31]|nr:MAG: L-aspartate oxidase [Spirochaetes bacterium GWB1_60_80]OHD34229.1 MAG: L-aspartate oxidase [Spirochaetes bacterium GWC1_61_12]OHD40157.1 MAG: L-aspartate oxidase [Spirochaetes bacterium GWD1_61_31]OHD45795.1 MAG: L-aspartate oxidase [Spirochaetes bacterium GWE1_60_18]OHD58338.1 MAG: L-aspartate oxidase [Spirochaetes bacterium GWF1_60_12]HAW86335.1 L-aspartate oxidase [Spirochaetaceae bacterium]